MAERTRLELALRLLLLLALPLALIFGLFSFGVWVGARNAERVQSFEREVLGLRLPEAKQAPSPWAPTALDAWLRERSEKPVATPPGTPTPEGTTGTGTGPGGGPGTGPVGVPYPVACPACPTCPAAGACPEAVALDAITPLSGALPLGDERLADALAQQRVVRVFVRVEREWVERDVDWLATLHRTVGHAAADWKALFGIELRLVGVDVWDVSSATLTAEQLHADLRKGGRRGADLVIGFGTRQVSGGEVAGLADAPKPDDEFNGTYAVVLPSRGRKQPYLHTFLHELGHLFGALDVEDPTSDAWSGGSFMSYAPPDEAKAPWIDSANRAIILRHKPHDFVEDASKGSPTP